MKKVSVYTLMFEVGRRCNMKCEHCLRGCAQDVSMPFEAARKVIDQVSQIGSIVFTGGEPMLYADMIIKIIDYIQEKGIGVGSFYIATNGKYVDKRLLSKLLELYAYCDDPDVCALDLSSDRFHEDISQRNVKMMAGLSFFNKKHDFSSIDYVIREGNAAENGIGKRYINSEPKPFDWEEFNGEISENNMVYVNVHGEIFPECDFSYETQAEYGAWNIYEHTLEEIITNFATETCGEKAA